MNIVVVARKLPDEKNMNGIFELDQAKALADAGHRVAFFAVDIRSFRHRRKWGVIKGTINGKAGSINTYVINIPIGILGKPFHEAILKCASEKLFRILLSDFGKPDVLHAHFRPNYGYAAALCEKYDIPLVITEHESVFNKDKCPASLLGKVIPAYRRADARIAVSLRFAERMKKHTGLDFLTINNVIDTNSFEYNGRISGDEIFRFVCVGNLLFAKGYDTLLRATAELKKRKINCLLTCIGKGGDETAIRNLCEELGLDDCVTFAGQRPRDYIAAVFGKSDAFVLPSRGETFGVSYVEAMAAGLPVIATKCGGPEDFINDDVGMLVPVDDVSALADAMSDMIKNRAHFDGEKISAYAKKRFCPSEIAAKLTEIYEDVLRKYRKVEE